LAVRPGTGAWLNYDFVPGDRILFSEDFTVDPVGDFPRSLELRGGNMEIVEWAGRRWLRSAGEGRFVIQLPDTLPTRYTVEFEFIGRFDREVWVYPVSDRRRAIFASGGTGGVDVGDVIAMGGTSGFEAAWRRVHYARLMVDGNYAKAYVDSIRVGNVPNAALGRSRTLELYLGGRDSDPVFLTSLRVAAGGRPLYDVLVAQGRVATHGIYFDVGSSEPRAESTPTLKEIGLMLQAHPDLRLLIEGHTDNGGNAEANLALSARRAEAVREYLLTTYGIESARLEARGFGASRPAAPNATALGRQTNRRVELVRL
jgi:outer membrane protein OmpA-like peptidoglycan-associated protein